MDEFDKATMIKDGEAIKTVFADHVEIDTHGHVEVLEAEILLSRILSNAQYLKAIDRSNIYVSVHGQIANMDCHQRIISEFPKAKPD